ncbi:hypothetical protein HY572_00765 [Candidatus Micrarchaeota archaeon]|nr:hypothetical protein [Candidatus Micrarchaeota archaeon]
MKWLNVGLMALLLIGMVGLVAAEDTGASAGGSADASVNVKPSARPLGAKVADRVNDVAANARDRVQNVRDNVQDRVKDVRENVRERLNEADDRKVLDRQQAFRDKVVDRQNRIQDGLQEKFGDRLEQVREQRAERLDAVKERIADAEGRLKEFRAKLNLTDEEKNEFKAKVVEHLQAGFDQRIALAEKLEAEGADAQLVADFILFAQGQKEAFAAAETNDERRDLVVEFNQKWREFKQAVAKGMASHRIELAVAKARELLERMSGVIDRLEAAGFDVSKLDALEDRIDEKLESVLQQETLREAVHELKQAHKGLMHLKRAIQAVINHELVDEFREDPAPSAVGADVAVELTTSAAVDAEAGESTDSDDAAQEPSATPSASEIPTASADASASPQASASAEASVAASAS